MNFVELNRATKSLNLQYREMFGYVPCVDDFSCSYDEYIIALKKAVENKCEISSILVRKERPSSYSPNIRY